MELNEPRKRDKKALLLAVDEACNCKAIVVIYAILETQKGIMSLRDLDSQQTGPSFLHPPHPPVGFIMENKREGRTTNPDSLFKIYTT